MGGTENTYFDLQTVSLMKAALEEAWASLPQSEQARSSRSLLGQRILRAAAEGECDPERLIQAALVDQVAA